MHGKAWSKKHRRPTASLGNALDFWVQNTQDRQTCGIPIGPDTSLVLAELLLTAVDVGLTSSAGPLVGFRAIDDYELTFQSRARAEEALAALQSELACYELQLHPVKSRIVELPVPMEDLWPVELRVFEIRTGLSGQILDLIEYYSLAFELARTHRTSGVLRYAIGRTRRERILPGTWRTYQDLLLQCLRAEPGCLRYALSELRHYSRRHRLDKDRVGAVLDQLILRHLPLGNGSEVAWALWAAISLDVSIGKQAADRLPESDDPLVPLLALDADSRGLLPTGLDKTRWSKRMTEADLLGPDWLLAYEAAVQGWLPSASSKDHIGAHPGFDYLRRQGVSFYNRRASAMIIKKWYRQLTLAQLIGYDI